ncbi:MAG: type-F conjugative transfer system secretin TraK [Alphaproteobacteria bacterium]|uniref:Type-F conjugative transfer system secretin TraK n=1 Tax=Candidatus Nitrobium versatile TaxID=2884831 RepID=A0A953SHZ7_9BACT|nr:type-F conjugative transfer system secretin TraK [Candidatus Nitrobium versatile]
MIRRILVVFSLLFAIPMSLHAAEGKRFVEWNGDVVTVFGGPGKVIQVNFPSKVETFISATENIDIKYYENSAYIKILSHELLEPQVFIITQEARVPLLLKLSPENVDFIVDVIDVRQKMARKRQEEQRLGKEIDPVSLIVAMSAGQPLPGFSVTEREHPLQRFSRNGTLNATLKKIYQSPLFTGYVVELKNVSVLPLKITVQDLVGPNVMAAALERPDGYIAPTPQTAEGAQAGRHRMLVYVVVSAGARL